MDDYNRCKRVVCPNCKGRGTVKAVVYDEDDYGRMIRQGYDDATCEMCRGSRVMDKVTTYRGVIE